MLEHVVVPAVKKVFADDEIDSLRLFEGDVGLSSDSGNLMTLELRVGEDLFQYYLVDRRAPAVDIETARERLRSALVDFVATSSFGWGQDRSTGTTRDDVDN